MSPARWPRERALDERLLVVERRTGRLVDARVGELPGWLAARDLLVVNDAATLPASLSMRVDERAGDPALRGAPVEVRLLGAAEAGTRTLRAVLFGAGDWRTPTEHRPPPPALPVGARLVVAPSPSTSGTEHARTGLALEVVAVSPRSPRLVELRPMSDGEGDGRGEVDGAAADDALVSALYRAGRPVQYAHVAAPLALWHVQTVYASRPWAAELPSAGRPLRWELVAALRRRGIRIARVTHAAGLSSTGDAALDALLPLAERYEVPPETVRAVEETRAGGGRVVAVGTSVVRALEGCAAAHGGRLVAAAGETDLLLDGDSPLRVASALLTGLHDQATTHFALLQAFAPRPLLERVNAHADAAGYLAHEFGDSCLLV